MVDNDMLRVHDWLPYNAAGSDNGSLNSLVVGTQFCPDGALYMARVPVGCCCNQVNTQQVQRRGRVEAVTTLQSRSTSRATTASSTARPTAWTPPPRPARRCSPCSSSTRRRRRSPRRGSIPPRRGRSGTYRSAVTVNLSASDACAGVDFTEYRVDGGDWETAANVAGDVERMAP